MRLPAAAALLAAALAAAALRAPDARADKTEFLRPGQSFVGDVPPGDTIRLTVDLARDAELRLTLTLQLTGADTYLPANFQRVSVTDGDGNVVPFDTGLHSSARYDVKKRRSTFTIRNWKAPSGGPFTFAITHKTQVRTVCSGRVKSVRTLRTAFDETTGPTITVPVQPDDRTHVVVTKGKTGGAPRVESYLFTPGGTAFLPSQKTTKKGATSRLMGVLAFGDATWTVGPQSPDAPLGQYRGAVILTPYTRYGRAVLDDANPPNVALTVHDPSDGRNAFLDVTWATTGAGLSWNGSYMLVTGEANNGVYGKYYNDDLTDPGPLVAAKQLVYANEFTAPEVPGRHRVIRAANAHYVACVSASGQTVLLDRFSDNLVRDSSLRLVEGGSALPDVDAFLATDEYTVAVGVPRAPTGHTVYLVDTATMIQAATPVSIGDTSRPHSAGAGAAYRSDQNVWELWAPTSIAPSQPSNLGHGLYGPAWNAVLWEPGRVDDPSLTIETMSTGVVVDPATGVTVLHYVVPSVDATGFGILHRRLFDPLGNEVPNSHATLGVIRRNRPAVAIVGSDLYVAAEGLANPVVMRFRLQR